MITTVYARCNALDRLEVWKDIDQVAYANQIPWIIGEDINVILNKEEKLGELFLTQHEATYFLNATIFGAITKFKFIGSKYT